MMTMMIMTSLNLSIKGTIDSLPTMSHKAFSLRVLHRFPKTYIPYNASLYVSVPLSINCVCPNYLQDCHIPAQYTMKLIIFHPMIYLL